MNEIFLSGTVGLSFWGEECFTPTSVREQLEGMTGPLTVHLNSGGGVATDGQAIYTALKNYDGAITVVIVGIAASAASLIAMAGDEIVMPLGSILMIHDPANWSVEGRGTEDDHLNAAKGLGVIANAYAAIYAARSGISIDEARAIMKAETYFDGEAAVAAGFATSTDSAIEAEEVAAFDYRIYARAPQHLRAVGGSLSRRRSTASVVAMMTGNSVSSHGGSPMKKKPKAATAARVSVATAADEEETTALEEEETTAEEDLNPTAEGEEEETTAEGEEEEVPGEGDEEEDPAVEATAIIQLAARRGIPAEAAGRYIAARMTVEQVSALHPKKGLTMSKPRAPLTRAQIQRDERTTRRAAAAEALHAQMTRKRDVSPAARPYMQMSIVEIAASVTGLNGRSMRNFGEREAILMEATHSTSDFPGIFQNALNKTLLERYSEFEPTYRRVSKQKNFRDFRPMPLVRTGDFPTLMPLGEGGEIKAGTFGESNETALIVPYARRLNISRQMMVNDELGAIEDLLSSYGSTIAHFEERTFYAFALSAKLADGTDLFHASRNNLAGAGAAINRASLSAARAAIRKQKSIDGQALNLSPSVLLVGPDKETEAEAILAEITPTDAANVNPFSGKLSPVVTAEITGNAWYVLSDRAPCWVYGFLEGAEAPRVRTEEPFGTQGFSMTVEHDFGFGAVDFRGGYKNAGA